MTSGLLRRTGPDHVAASLADRPFWGLGVERDEEGVRVLECGGIEWFDGRGWGISAALDAWGERLSLFVV